ncbi:MAG: alpha-N-arabinofuranosidase [Propionibacteriaceae bacterium]|jgi:alpha-N-arabinofuranosidase|nr:alpha-N-arabinofuranosidase [Propionibacteriaceae bacterium]
MASATITVDPADQVAPVHRRLFGAFVEHLGRCVYGGIYEPGHPAATPEGFRQDVIDLVRELGTTTIRYPGGNFVSGYCWEDGIGPRDRRPRRLDPAWHSIETNEIGVDEFAAWCRLTGHELMLAVNLGTRGVLDAIRLQEYVNHPGGTALSDARAANGSPEPYGVTMWCLGNEMDAPWQLGHMSADDYGKLAYRTAAAMRQLEPGLELVVCGSSGSQMPTFGEWERVVLEHCYDVVDYVSCHAYYEIRDHDLGTFLASSLDMARFIATVATTADHIKAKRRTDKTINLSFDEWNVWYVDEHMAATQTPGGWEIAPRALEDVYTLADAVVVGNLLITLLQHADRVTSASLAQLVNAIAPIRTEPGGPAWRQTTFHPFAHTSRLARGVVLATRVDCGTYANATYGEVPLVDAVVTHDEATGRSALFVVNRDTAQATTVDLDVARLGVTSVLEAVTLSDDDPFAVNTAEQPDRVVPRPNPTAHLSPGGRLSVTLPPLSWTAVSLLAASDKEA